MSGAGKRIPPGGGSPPGELPEAATEAVNIRDVNKQLEKRKEERASTALGKNVTPPVADGATQFAALPRSTSAEVGLFDRLEATDRAAIERLGETRSYSFGQTIMEEGADPDGVHFLIEGRARVVKKSGRANEIALAMLEPGDVFGESALSGAPRSATVRASAQVSTLFLPRAELEGLIKERPQLRGWLDSYAEKRRISTLLKDQSPFVELSNKTRDALIERLVPSGFSSGQRVFREGDPSGPMYLVQRGRLRVKKRMEDGNELAVAYLREGSILGEESCLNRSPRNTSVEALTDVSLLALAPQPFQELFHGSPSFAKCIRAHIDAQRYEQEAQMPLDIAELLRAGPPKAGADASAGEADGASTGSASKTKDTEQSRPGSEPDPSEEAPFKSKDGFFIKGRDKIGSFPFVYQIDEMDCGAACLAMICRHYGRRVALGRVRSLAYAGVDGVSLGNLVNAASELGLAARTAKVSQANVEKMPLPAVVHWEGNHWVVLLEAGPKRARIADPAIGIRTISREALDRSWNGFSALFDFTDALLDNPEQKRGLGWALNFLRPFRSVLAASVLLAAVVAALTMVVPVFTQVVVDRVVVGGASDAMTGLLIALGVTFTFLLLARIMQGYFLAFIAVRVDAALFDFLTRKLLALPMPYFLARRTGDIQQRLDGARELRRLGVQNGITSLLAFVQLIAALGIMALYSPVLLGTYLAVVPLYIGLMFISARVLRPVFGKVEESFGRYRSDQLDAIKGMEAVKVSSGEPQFREALLDRFLRMSKEQFQADYTVLTYQGLLQAVGYLATVLFLWVGAQLAMAGTLTIGGFVAFSSLVALANQPIMVLLDFWDQLQRGRALLDRLEDVFSYEPEQGLDRSRLIPVRTLSSGIELRGVGFRYGGTDSAPVLRGIDLMVQPGETIAIVGRSGSGKTTLAKLISGLLEPTDGSILFDGVEQRLLNYRDLRRHVGYVLQENHIFSGTILENIAFGAEPDMERAINAARAAAAHEFVSKMPLGYTTRVGESGIRLSGGQAQRIAIARALYKSPSILIFDEATSALDTESERLIQNNFETYLSGRTAFVIAHRLSTVRNASRIAVLENGQLVELGNHDELMKKRGLYHELVSRQIEQ